MKISLLTRLLRSALVANDIIPIVDVSSGATRHVQLADLMMNQRNRVHNANFLINQRAVSGTVTLAAGAFGHDRWKAGASGCTYTFASAGGVTVITITAGSLVQVIEGSDLQTGTHILTWNGTAQGKIGAGSFAASGVSASVTGGANLAIEFGVGTLSLVQLEPGVIATPFEFRSAALDQLLCQRFYETGFMKHWFHGAAGSNNGTTRAFQVVKRGPALITTSAVSLSNCNTLTIENNNTSTRELTAFANIIATGGAVFQFNWAASSDI